MIRAALAALLLVAPAPTLADALIDNVNGITVDATGGLVRFDGLVIDKDGKVLKRLMPGDRRPERPDFRLDGQGRTLVPGFFDSHVHLMDLGFARLTLDLSASTSLDEAKAAIAVYAAANPDRPWIVGTGWDPARWRLGRMPTAADLTGISAGRPIWLTRIDGRAGWANDAALKAAGITAKTRSPAGGSIVLAAGLPSGVLLDAAMGLMTKAVPQPLPKDYDAALAKAQDDLLGHGVTAVADMGTDIQAWQAFRRAGDRGTLRIRIIGYAGGMEQASLIAGPGPTSWLYDDRLRLAGVKLAMDGSLGARDAWLKMPYADAPGTSGRPRITPTQLRNQMSRAAMDGFQLAIHAIGDRANAEVLDAIDALSETYSGDRRWRIEHAQIVASTELPRFALHGIIASMQPQHAASDGPMAAARLGPGRADGFQAWRAMLANWVPLAFGSDTPAAPPDPLLGLEAAMTGAGHPDRTLAFAEALRAYSWAPAYAGFAEMRFGNLAPGQRADFLILDSDPSRLDPADLPAARIFEVWIGGRRASMAEAKP